MRWVAESSVAGSVTEGATRCRETRSRDRILSSYPNRLSARSSPRMRSKEE